MVEVAYKYPKIVWYHTAQDYSDMFYLLFYSIFYI
jgi:hypothetical protein